MVHVRLRSMLLVVLCCGIACSLAAAQTQGQQQNSTNNKQLSSQDRQYVEHMAKGSQGEVQIAQMVESKTSNPQVKEFAQRMVHDHTLLNQQLKQLMEKKGMTMPAPMTAQQKQLKAKLEGMSGAQLDKTFMQAQVKDHEQDVQQAEKHAQNAKQMQPSDPDVAQLAQESLPVLREHLTLSKQLSSQLGGGTTTSAQK